MTTVEGALPVCRAPTHAVQAHSQRLGVRRFQSLQSRGGAAAGARAPWEQGERVVPGRPTRRDEGKWELGSGQEEKMGRAVQAQEQHVLGPRWGHTWEPQLLCLAQGPSGHGAGGPAPAAAPGTPRTTLAPWAGRGPAHASLPPPFLRGGPGEAGRPAAVLSSQPPGGSRAGAGSWPLRRLQSPRP